MENIQRLRTRRRATKSSVTKLLGKVDGILSADLEGVNSQSVKEAAKLMADTTLCQLKAKQGQLVELNNVIAEKIDDETELEEDISKADAYQFDLDERIAFLTEFLRKASQAPPAKPTDAHTILPTSPPPTDSSAVHSDTQLPVTTDSLTSSPVVKPTEDTAFRRFASRRSLPRLMLSDNASTYLAAAEELKSLLSSEELAESLSRRGVDWRFIPKRAPWFGGFWERLIGLTKSVLKKILGRSHVTLDSLQTIVVEVEAVLNNRPLTHVSADVNDIDPITPSHLLYGRPIISLPYQRVEDDEIDDPTYGDDADIRKRTKTQALLFKHFWTRWQKEYLTSLREFHRSTGNNTQMIGVGDVVLIHDDAPRIQWRLGVVEHLNKGNDGFARSANVRTSTGQTNRPITKLYPLEVTAAELP
ncbi:uncharacterized protein [Dysidea avara]|uniref:uncharacterized protein n=1 Tax=Dysidea avara TaxID=196820 RepID=UPI0033273ED6